ncbi:MAG: hypothetical protein V4645_29780 [Pseudomonadota bacterium]
MDKVVDKQRFSGEMGSQPAQLSHRLIGATLWKSVKNYTSSTKKKARFHRLPFSFHQHTAREWRHIDIGRGRV